MRTESGRGRRAAPSTPNPYAPLWQRAERSRRSRISRQHSHRRLVLMTVIVVATAVLLLIGAVAAAGRAGWGPAAGPSDGQAPPSMTSATSTDPFAGTPAARYPAGDAGLVLPTVPAEPGWQPADVAAVLSRTRAALIAARLDPRVVEGGDASAYLALLSPGTRPMVSAAIGKGELALGYVTRLAPGFRLDSPQAVRVTGYMSVAVGKDRQLVVTADYVWVYALRGPTAAAPGAGSRLVILHSVETYEWYRPAAVTATDRGLRPGGGTGYEYNGDCAQIKRGLLALPAPGQASGRPSAPADEAYDPSTNPRSLPSTCRGATAAPTVLSQPCCLSRSPRGVARNPAAASAAASGVSSTPAPSARSTDSVPSQPSATASASASAAGCRRSSVSAQESRVLPPRSTYSTRRPSTRTTSAPALRPGRWPAVRGVVASVDRSGHGSAAP